MVLSQLLRSAIITQEQPKMAPKRVCVFTIKLHHPISQPYFRPLPFNRCSSLWATCDIQDLNSLRAGAGSYFIRVPQHTVHTWAAGICVSRCPNEQTSLVPKMPWKSRVHIANQLCLKVLNCTCCLKCLLDIQDIHSSLTQLPESPLQPKALLDTTGCFQQRPVVSKLLTQ